MQKIQELEKCGDVVGTTLIIFLSIAVILCWFGPPAFILLELDAIQYILDDFVLSHVYNRTIPEVLAGIAIQTFLLGMCGQEIMRLAMLFMYGVLVVSYGIISVEGKLRCLKSNIKSAYFYSQLQVGLKVVR